MGIRPPITTLPLNGAGGYWTDGTKGLGVLGNTVGSLPHQANYYNGGYTTGGVNGFLTDVGAFTMSLSAYGLYDASGDVFQWNDAIVGSSRGFRGGAWDSTSSSSLLATNRGFSDPTTASSDIGFRFGDHPRAVSSASYRRRLPSSCAGGARRGSMNGGA